MTTALLILAVLAALACPLHAVLRARRGRRGCVVHPDRHAATLPDRQAALAERIDAVAAGRAAAGRD